MLKGFKPIDFRSNSIWKALFTTILVYILQQLFVYIFISLLGENLIAYAIGNLFLCTLLIILERKHLLNQLKTFKEDTKGKNKQIIIVTIVLLILEFIANMIIIKIINKVPDNTQGVLDAFNLGDKYIIGFIFNTLIIFPVLETLMFFYPYHNIKNRKLAFIVYTIVFAILHMITASSLGDLLYIIPYTLLSFAITYGYYKSNNICYPIIVHILNNVIALINILIIR